MNIIEYKSSDNRKDLVFCIVDDTKTYSTDWIREIIKNLADFTISNVFVKGYDILVGFNEDTLVQRSAELGYKYSVIMSPGTEFINGLDFFKEVENLILEDFFLAGHILDRGDAYYELHHQCFIVNLEYYKQFGFPKIGQLELGQSHVQIEPLRSTENIHDDYTPIWIKLGNKEKLYSHKCHGWSILSVALKENKKCIIFNDKIRNSKKHHYPESKKDFEKSLPWLYFRKDFCATEFVHTANTEKSNLINEKFDQIILPASGTLYLDLIDQGNVIFYDYNQKSLDYWKEHISYKSNISYSFIKTDLLVDDILLNHINKNANKTLINLSNIFCYEGTAAFYPLSYRFNRQHNLLKNLKLSLKNLTINFTSKAETGFTDLENPSINDLKKPTWHYNQDLS